MAALHYSPAQISAIAQSHGAPKWVGDALGATSVPESGGDPNAYNASTATGLLQIRASAWPQLAHGGNLRDADYNVQSALYVLSKQGSIAWSASGTWHGPPVPAGRFHFPLPKAGGATTRNIGAPIATGAAAPASSGSSSSDVIGMFAAPLLRGLLYVGLVGAGVVLAVYGSYHAANAASDRKPGGTGPRLAKTAAKAVLA